MCSSSVESNEAGGLRGSIKTLLTLHVHYIKQIISQYVNANSGHRPSVFRRSHLREFWFSDEISSM